MFDRAPARKTGMRERTGERLEEWSFQCVYTGPAESALHGGYGSADHSLVLSLTLFFFFSASESTAIRVSSSRVFKPNKTNGRGNEKVSSIFQRVDESGSVAVSDSDQGWIEDSASR